MSSSAIQKNQDSLQDLEKWIKHHHRLAHTDKRTGEEVHVYAIAGPPVFEAGDSRAYDFNIEIPIWGVTFILRGSIDLLTLSINATFAVRIPILGEISLANVRGDLKQGVSVTFGVSGIISGTVTFTARDGWLYMDLSATILGTTYGPLSIRLIPLP